MFANRKSNDTGGLGGDRQYFSVPSSLWTRFRLPYILIPSFTTCCNPILKLFFFIYYNTIKNNKLYIVRYIDWTLWDFVYKILAFLIRRLISICICMPKPTYTWNYHKALIFLYMRLCNLCKSTRFGEFCYQVSRLTSGLDCEFLSRTLNSYWILFIYWQYCNFAVLEIRIEFKNLLYHN